MTCDPETPEEDGMLAPEHEKAIRRRVDRFEWADGEGRTDKYEWAAARGALAADSDKDIPALLAEIDRLRAHKALLVAEMETRTEHEDHEDCWYSCPKHESCCNSNWDDVPESERPCECGADRARSVLERVKE